MSAFVENCVATAANAAKEAKKQKPAGKHAARLVRLLKAKQNLLVTTHFHPDPDALASSLGLVHLLKQTLPDADVTLSIKGQIGGGINSAFTKYTAMKITPWDDEKLDAFDAIVLLDTQPNFAFNPLPETHAPFAVIDHHRARGRRPAVDFLDIRPDVGATASIVFSYFMELEQPIPPELGAAMLFAIESDLAGAAGMPGHLDNLALSSLTLIADPRRLYRMRYVDLPKSYYSAYAEALATATLYDSLVTAHLGPIDSMEKPAVIADFLLRYEGAQWSLVTTLHEKRLVMSLRTSSTKLSAGDMMRRLVRGIGEGGGHRTKAGGFIPLEETSNETIEKFRVRLRKRLLNALEIKGARPAALVPAGEGSKG